MLVHNRSIGLLAVVSLVGGSIVGCHRSNTAASSPRQLNSTNGAARSTERSGPFVHDVGVVIAGTPLRHHFNYRNETQTILRLLADSQIQLSCGCTRVQVTDRLLQPGQSMTLTLEVNTDAKLGPVHERATVPWLTDSGHAHEVQFELRGFVQPAVAFDPSELTFSRDDILRGVTKNVLCHTDLPVDLQTAQVVPTANFIELVEHSVKPASSDLVVAVRCEPSDTGDSRQASLRIMLPVPSNLLPGQSAWAVSTLPIYAADTAAFRISPHRVVLSRDDESAAWHGTAILTGDALRTGGTIADCEVAELRTAYEQVPIGPAAVRLHLQLWADERPLARNSALTVTLSSGDTATVPLLLPELTAVSTATTD